MPLACRSDPDRLGQRQTGNMLYVPPIPPFPPGSPDLPLWSVNSLAVLVVVFEFSAAANFLNLRKSSFMIVRMGGTGGSSSRSSSSLTISTALEKAREASPDEPEPDVVAFLTAALDEIWRKIRLQPDSYILSNTEYSLFNFYLQRYREDPLTAPAISRHWNNRKEPETNCS
jgi:hypothetical protein